MSKENDTSDSKKEGLHAEYDDLSKKLEALEMENKELKESVTEKDNKIQSLNKKIAKNEDEMVSIEDLQSKITKLEKENTDLKKEIKNSPLKLEIEDLESQNKSLQEDLEKLKQEYAAVTSSMEDKYGMEIESFRNKISDLEADKKKMHEELVQFRRTVERPVQKAPVKTMRKVTAGLNDILSADKLADQLFKRIKTYSPIKMRLLAMQTGVSTAKARETIDKLADVNAIKMDDPAKEDPIISL